VPIESRVKQRISLQCFSKGSGFRHKSALSFVSSSRIYTIGFHPSDIICSIAHCIALHVACVDSTAPPALSTF
jgi:hypothetical protein